MNYFELPPEQNTFHTLLADVTHKCNMRCKNCYIPNREIPDMDKDKFSEFLARLPKRTDIRLIGAEPTMRSDLIELIKMIRVNGHRSTMLTNGLKLSDYEFAKKVFDAGVKSLGISLNGGTNDSYYQFIDELPTGKRKVAALENCIRIGYVTHVNCILVKGINEDTPRDLFDLVMSLLKKYHRKIGPRYPIMLRFKSIGKIGRYMDNESFELSELLHVVADSIGFNVEELELQKRIDGHDECNSLTFKVDTELGPMFFKLTDWTIDDDGVPDSGSTRRGRITQEFNVAPFFEHVKRNENGY